LVAQTIVAYAREKGIACWDLFTVSGGKGSAKKWYKAGLFWQRPCSFYRNWLRGTRNVVLPGIHTKL
jgi:hypothetical protein